MKFKNKIDINKKVLSLSKQEWEKIYIQHATEEQNDIVPFPSDEIQQITNSKKGEITAKGAISILDCVFSCLSDVGVMEDSKNKTILDFGCGWGRMTRFLPYWFKTENIIGVDVDSRLINSANELLPSFNHILIESMKPLPFKNESVDIIFANSVFSHLSQKSAMYTLKELSRVLSRNGVMVISVLEKNELDKFYDNNEKQQKWISGILGEKEHALSVLKKEGFLWGKTGKWNEYGIAIMEEEWISKAFKEVGVSFKGSKKRTVKGSQNYKYGVKI